MKNEILLTLRISCSEYIFLLIWKKSSWSHIRGFRWRWYYISAGNNTRVTFAWFTTRARTRTMAQWEIFHCAQTIYHGTKLGLSREYASGNEIIYSETKRTNSCLRPARNIFGSGAKERERPISFRKHAGGISKQVKCWSSCNWIVVGIGQTRLSKRTGQVAMHDAGNKIQWHASWRDMNCTRKVFRLMSRHVQVLIPKAPMTHVET